MSEVKKLIAVHLLNDFSGSPKVLSQVISAVSEANFKVVLFIGSSSKGFLSKTASDTHTYAYNRSNFKFFTLLSLLISQVYLSYKILKYKDEDVIIYVNTMLPFGSAIIGKLLGKKVIYHIHETSLSPKLLKKFLRWIINKTASKIIFVSNSLKERELFKGKKQTVIYNALPKSFLNLAFKHSYSRLDKNGNFNIYMISSLKSYKGINEFVEIAQKCLTNNALKFILILNAKQKDIDKYFKNIKLYENIKIFKTQNDLHQHYKNAGLVLNLSRVNEWVETFGLTIIEAMAYGIPVIVPPVGGPSEIVQDDVEGYLISSYNTKQIANKIEMLFQDNSLCMRLSQNCKLKSKRFDESVFNKKILEILND